MPRLLDIIGTGRPSFVPVSRIPHEIYNEPREANQAITPRGEALSKGHSFSSLAIKS